MQTNRREGIEEIAEDASFRYLELIVVKKTVNPVTHHWVKEVLLEALTKQQQTHHQELQKARESERERIIAEIDNMKGYAVSLPEIDASLGELSSEDIEFTVQPFAQIIFKAEVIKALT